MIQDFNIFEFVNCDEEEDLDNDLDFQDDIFIIADEYTCSLIILPTTFVLPYLFIR
jgi:hypothetical protein